MKTAVRSAREHCTRRGLERALERGLDTRALPFGVAYLLVRRSGLHVVYHARLDVPLAHTGTPEPPEKVAEGWLEALADLTVDRGAFGRPEKVSGGLALGGDASARLALALGRGLRERGLPFELVTCAMQEDGTAWGLVDVAFEYSGGRGEVPGAVAERWLDRLVEACGGRGEG